MELLLRTGYAVVRIVKMELKIKIKALLSMVVRVNNFQCTLREFGGTSSLYASVWWINTGVVGVMLVH